jgi:hypothetical protein
LEKIVDDVSVHVGGNHKNTIGNGEKGTDKFDKVLQHGLLGGVDHHTGHPHDLGLRLPNCGKSLAANHKADIQGIQTILEIGVARSVSLGVYEHLLRVPGKDAPMWDKGNTIHGFKCKFVVLN